jgi:putative transcriptional regulator
MLVSEVSEWPADLLVGEAVRRIHRRDSASHASRNGGHRIRCHLDEVLVARGMTLTELSERTGITLANLSILKTNKARAVRFTTLTAICVALDSTPAQLFTLE